jgi:hypothetical protein
MSTLLLDYLITKQIGLVGQAFDLPGTIVTGFTYTPTSFVNFACGVPNGGPGELLFTEYAGLAQADGPHRVIGAPAWIVTTRALQAIEALNPGVAKHFFNTPRTFVVGSSATRLAQLAAPSALPTAKFTNESTLALEVQGGDLPAGTRAVMFDDEYGGNLTPRAQQLHPGMYYNRAAQAAHAAGLLLVAAPSRNLVYSRAPATATGKVNSEFLRFGIARAVARYADVYEIDAQGSEARSSSYAAFVQAVSAQAVAVHPGIELLAGLSTNPSGVKQRSKALLNAALLTRTEVAGFDLNDPGNRLLCPHCGSWYPPVATSFLRGLRRQGG